MADHQNASPGAATPSLSVLIPTYGRGPALGRLLGGLAAQTLAPYAFEVIVVDDGSPDPVTVDAGPLPYQLTVLRQDNAGPAAARNRGLERCRGELVLILNDDAVPSPDLLERHLAAHAELPEKCAVMGSFHFTEQARQSPFVRLLDETDLLFSFTKLEHNKTYPWQYFWTCNISLPTSAVREVGGFDAETFTAAICEDVELGYRLQQRGWQVVYREDCKAEHDHVLTPQDYIARAEKLGFFTLESYRKHRDPSIIWCKSHDDVEAALQASVSLVEQYGAVMPSLEAALNKFEEDYLGREIPPATMQQAHDLVRQISAVPVRRGMHRALHGFDLMKIAEEGAPAGTSVSVVVASYNALENTVRCIESLRAAADERYPMQIVVVDNGSTDGSVEWLSQQADLHLIRNPENYGAPRARNQAIPHCTGDWVAFLDNDVFVPNGWLERALYHGAVDPCVGSIPLVANRASKFQQVPFDGGTSPQELDEWARNHYLGSPRQGIDADLFTSLAVLVRRDVLDRIGGFDERFSPWGFEDDDIALRIRLAGWRNRVAKDTFVYHAHYQTQEKHERHSEWMRNNWERFAAKWGRPGPKPQMFDYESLHLEEIGEVDEARLVFPIPDPNAMPPSWAGYQPSMNLVKSATSSADDATSGPLPDETCTAIRAIIGNSNEEASDASPQATSECESSDGRRNVIILGSGRSGTSMLTGTLASAGWDVGGKPYPGREANPKGFFETAEVNGLNEYLICNTAAGESDLGPMQHWLAHLTGSLVFQVDDELRARMGDLTSRQPFALKDPRFCYTLPAWRDSLEDTRFICVFREPAVTAESILRECANADYLEGLEMTFEKAIDIWAEMYRRILEEHSQSGEWMFIHAEQLLTPGGITRLEEFVGGPVQADFPEAKLQRTKSEAPVPAEVGKLYRELCTRAGMPARELAEIAPATQDCAATEPELTVLICSYQRVDTLRRCLRSFEEQTAQGRYEIVIVNDGSSDGTRECLDSWSPKVPTQIIHRENGGLSAARNSGLEVARGKYVLLVNDDTIAEPDLVEQHLRAHADYGPNAAILGTFEQPANALDNALMRVLEHSYLVFCYEGLEPGRAHDWTRFWTCNVSVSTESVRSVGNFDESFRHYGCEDADLAIRLEQDCGVRVFFEPRARAFHEHILDFDDLVRRNRMVAKAFVRLFQKHPSCLQHPDWRSRLGNTVAAHEAHLVHAMPNRARAEQFARELSKIDLGALERGGPEGVQLSEVIYQQLLIYLDGLNKLWWAEGEMRGMCEFGLSGYSDLAPVRAMRDVDPVQPVRREHLAPVGVATPAATEADREAEEWPLATQAAQKFIAWPRYDTNEDIEQLFRAWGSELINHPDRCLCLRHDPSCDGDMQEAIARVSQVFESVIGPGQDLELLIVDGEMTPEDLPVLGRAITAVFELPAATGTERETFAKALGVPRLGLEQAVRAAS